MPRLDEAELDSRFGISGFQRVTLTVDNSDGLLSGHDLQDTYVRMFFVDAEGDVYREFKGKVTEWTLLAQVCAQCRGRGRDRDHAGPASEDY